MDKSRKMLIAAVFVASGYGLTVLLGGLSDFFWPRRLASGAAAGGSSIQSRPAAQTAAGPSAAAEARLIPEGPVSPEAVPAATQRDHPSTATIADAASATGPTVEPRWLQPVPSATWIGAGHQRHRNENDENTIAGDAKTVKQPASGDRQAMVASASQAASEEIESQPAGRLTGVRIPATIADESTPSPWDRWPAWKPPAAVTEPDDTPGPAEPSAEQEGDLPTQASFGDDPTTPAGPRRRHRIAPLGEILRSVENDLDTLRTHIVSDGDSLSRLADRYLDDPSLGEAIYELNREVIANPQLLPIGAELMIPETPPRPSANQASPQPTADPSSHETAGFAIENRYEAASWNDPPAAGAVPPPRRLPPTNLSSW